MERGSRQIFGGKIKLNVIIPVLIIILLLSLFTKQKKKEKIIISIFIIFLLGFVCDMGIDWTHYKEFYITIVPNVELKDIKFETALYERGYVILNYLFYILGFNYDMFIGSIRIACLYFIFSLLYKESGNYLYSLFFMIPTFLFGYTTEPVIRQLIAVVISYYALDNLIKKKKGRYFLFSLTSYLFHSSGIICFMYFIINYFKLNLKKSILGIIALEIGILNSKKILELLIVINSNFSKYLPYLNSIKKSSISLSKMSILLILIILYLIVLKSIKNIKLKKMVIYQNFMWIHIICIILETQLIFLYRFQSYFLLYVSIVLSFCRDTKIFSFKLKKSIILFLIGILNIIIFSYGNLKVESLKYKTIYYHNYIIKLIKNSFMIESKEKQMENLKKYKIEYFRIIAKERKKK